VADFSLDALVVVACADPWTTAAQVLDGDPGAIDQAAAGFRAAAAQATPILVPDLANEHTALHLRYPAAGVPELARKLEDSDGKVFDITFPDYGDNPERLAEFLSVQLKFPETTGSWNVVNDLAADLDLIETTAGYLIVLRGLGNLAGQPLWVREAATTIWLSGIRRFQFTERSFHVLLIGDDTPGVDLRATIRRTVPLERMNSEMLANIGYGSARIPVYDWATGSPELVVE
jgi:hypothetical protein